MATITEIAQGVYRINMQIPDRPVTYSLFLIVDDTPTLIDTSFGGLFDEVREAVSKVLDPRSIQHIVVPHFEAADVLEEFDMGGYSVYFHGLLPARMSVSRGHRLWTCWGEEDRAWLYSYFLQGELL